MMSISQCIKYIIERDFNNKIDWNEPILFQVDSEEIDHISESLLNIARCGKFDIGDAKCSPEDACYKYTIHALQHFDEFAGKKNREMDEMVPEDYDDFVLMKLTETANASLTEADKADDLNKAILKRRKDLFRYKQA
jgi:hypothetical protein